MENKSIGLAILGVVAVIGIVGLILLFTAAKSAGVVAAPSVPKLYVYGEGGEGTFERLVSPVDPTQIAQEYGYRKGNVDVGYGESTASQTTNPCYPDNIAPRPTWADYTVVDAYGSTVYCMESLQYVQ